MPNITLSIPEEIRKRMKKYPEIKWSEVVRRAIVEYLDRLAGSETVDIEHYARLAEKLGVNLETISIEEAESHYKRSREMEWERHSTTQAS